MTRRNRHGRPNPLGALRAGRVDLVAVRLPFAQPGIEVGLVVDTDPRVLAVARHDPLARCPSVSLEVLGDRPVLGMAGVPDHVLDPVVPSRTPSGRPVRVGLVVESTRIGIEAFSAIGRGTVVHLTVASVADHFGHPDVVFVPVHDARPRAAPTPGSQDRGPRRPRAFAAQARAIWEERGSVDDRP